RRRAVIFFLPYGPPIGLAPGILKRVRQCLTEGPQADKRLTLQLPTEFPQPLRLGFRANKVVSHFRNSSVVRFQKWSSVTLTKRARKTHSVMLGKRDRKTS